MSYVVFKFSGWPRHVTSNTFLFYETRNTDCSQPSPPNSSTGDTTGTPPNPSNENTNNNGDGCSGGGIHDSKPKSHDGDGGNPGSKNVKK